MSSDIPDLSEWVLVPKVATMDMVASLLGCYAIDAWPIMLSKAPSPPIDVSAMLAERDALGLQLDEAQKSLQEIIATLSDPEEVRINILRGFIKVPADLVFLYDSDGPVAEKVREARRSALEEAACLIEAHQVGYGGDGPTLAPRYEGNRDGMPYAAAIRALISAEEVSP